MSTLAAVVARALLALWLLAPWTGASAAECVAMVYSGGGGSFWRLLLSGVQAAGAVEGLQIHVRGTAREGDVPAQLRLIDKVLQAHCRVLVLAPGGPEIAVKVAALRTQGISTLYVDRGIEGSAAVGLVSSDNFKAGQLAGQRMAQVLGGHGQVALLRNHRGVASTRERERGFVESASAGGLQIIFDAYPDLAAAQPLAALVARLDRLDGLFTPNQSTTLLTLAALRRVKPRRPLTFIGVDADAMLIEALRRGEISGLVLQQSYQMGFQAVQQAARLLHGESHEVGPVLLAPVYVDRVNIDQAAIAELLPLAEEL